MTAGIQDFIIEQGADFAQTIIWKDETSTPIDLTGYTARMQGREKITSSEILFDITTENSGILLGGDTGSITLLVSADSTSAITVSSAVYDLILTSSTGTVTRLLQGDIQISERVTR